MKTYIKSKGIVSPQCFINNENWLDDIEIYETNPLKNIEPEYKELVHPKYLRKMPVILKTGLYTAMQCLKNAGIENADAIITATGHGCQFELEKFFNQIVENDEDTISPVSFIHSTHSLISSQIAVMLQNHNYNMNYINDNFSFENALIDAMMLLNENEAENVLVGSFDEITEENFSLFDKLNYWKKENINNSVLYNTNTPGSIGGEGSAFFCISSENNKNCPEIKSVNVIYKPGKDDIKERLIEITDYSDISINDIDLIILGKNGDVNFDYLYDEFIENNFQQDIASISYKHLCGEYHTSSGFALALASHILEYQKIPASFQLAVTPMKKINNILIYNHFRGVEHSMILAGIE